MMTLIAAALAAANPAPAPDAHAQHQQGQPSQKKDCCKDCCKDMAAGEKGCCDHGADHAGHGGTK